MKNLIISIVCILILLIPWGIYHRFSESATDRYQAIITNQIIPAAESEDWQLVQESFDFIATDWTRFRKISAYFIDTQSLEDVSEHISTASCYIQQQDSANTIVTSVNLQNKLNNLHENDAPSIGNLF